MFKNFLFLIIFAVLIFPGRVLSAEDPDELYRQGRFAEAEKIYALSDMDHPKDIRYRYNRGCAAYQGSDYKGAMGAFSSVLRRTKDKGVRFRALYNLGNTAFKQGDLQSASEFYKQAVMSCPDNEDARYNLELTLREIKKQKKDKESCPKKEPQESSDQGSKDQEGKDKDQKQEKQEKEPGKDGKPEQEEGGKQDEGQTEEQETPEDLSGELKARDQSSMGQKEDQPPAQAMPVSETDQAGIDKKKAEALLDNIKEDRSRFLHLQVPEDKRHGVRSGKDW
ncbi:MAG: tetratricopeptide repeat protein [Thermodesulfobacteriota bacterium]|nr:tetratricopeptide repeat protein [Thermodesulfobacteriota bacterium]